MNMKLARRLTLPAKGATEFIVGLAMMAAPAILSFPAAGMVLGVTLGAILTGKGLATGTSTRQRAVDVRQFDAIYIVATGAAALGTAVKGEVAATIMLAVVVVIETVLSLIAGSATGSERTSIREARTGHQPARKSGPSPGYRPNPTPGH
jgi:hypothetical protein